MTEITIAGLVIVGILWSIERKLVDIIRQLQQLPDIEKQVQRLCDLTEISLTSQDHEERLRDLVELHQREIAEQERAITDEDRENQRRALAEYRAWDEAGRPILFFYNLGRWCSRVARRVTGRASLRRKATQGDGAGEGPC